MNFVDQPEEGRTDATQITSRQPHRSRRDRISDADCGRHGCDDRHRIGIGIELKSSYYRQAVKNVAAARELKPETMPLFAGMDIAV